MKIENKAWQVLVHGILILIAAMCIIPFVLLVMSSVASNNSIILHGYSFWPHKFSNAAYMYLYQHGAQIVHAYGITVFNATVGTAVGLSLTALLAYPLARKDLPGRNIIMFLVFFTLLFNGGLVPTYWVYTHVIDINNTILAQIIPYLLMNALNVLIMRTFFATTIPDSVLESARIDGASEYRTFYSIVLPLSLPVLATIGLLQCIMYWNDFMNGLIFITNPHLLSIQNVLNNILTDIQFLQSYSAGSSQAAIAAAQIPDTTVRMAIAVIVVIPIMVAYPFFQKYFVKGMTIGAVKG